MPDKQNTPVQNTQPNAQQPRFSFNLMHGAASGRFATRKKSTDSAGAAAPQPPATEDKPDVEVKYRQPVTEDAAVPLENASQDPLAQDRIKMDLNDYFSATSGRKELLITASAAKSLTRLFAALALEPGSGREVPAHIRTQVLDSLVRESHRLAQDIGESIIGGGGRLPVYLRAKLLQQAAEFVSDQWAQHGKIDTRGLVELSRAAFGSEVHSINQDVVDLFHLAGEYTPANDRQISDARITEAAVRASWLLYRQVGQFDINDYDPHTPAGADPRPFTYGKGAHEVSLELTKMVLAITHENRLDIDHLDLATTWTQNSIDRAASLVRAEYRMLTDRALRSSFREDLLSEAAINSVVQMYDKIMQRIHERARNGFIIVERNAIDAMSANSYAKYLPKAQPSHETGEKSGNSHEQHANGSDTTQSGNEPDDSKPTSQAAQRPGTKFFFG